jgi:hypothetical protein
MMTTSSAGDMNGANGRQQMSNDESPSDDLLAADCDRVIARCGQTEQLGQMARLLVRIAYFSGARKALLTALSAEQNGHMNQTLLAMTREIREQFNIVARDLGGARPQ